MQFTPRFSVAVGIAVFSILALCETADVADGKHHHHHHKHHKHHHASQHQVALNATTMKDGSNLTSNIHKVADAGGNGTSEDAILAKMKKLEETLKKQEDAPKPVLQGKIEVNGPLPADFSERFVQAAAMAAGINPVEIQVIDVQALGTKGDLAEVIFQGEKDVVRSLEHQSCDPDSKLANSPIRSFLIAHDDADEMQAASEEMLGGASASLLAKGAKATSEPTQANGGDLDIDTAMPYGELEPFGREDTAQELTESSVKESDQMVDQVERAEVAEEKRSVFRALTRLRGAAITSFDGVARSQTGNIDEYNKVHKWRSTHPLHHLADEESDISKWAFPDNADF